MSARTLARRLERVENRLNPAAKPGITVIVVRAGEPEAEINPIAKPGITVIVAGAGEPEADLERFSGERQNVSEGKGLDD